eukprot:COSAG02_NODE_9032_length_2355_cov_1.647606_3_plen_65_part_00
MFCACHSPVLSDALWFDDAESMGQINWIEAGFRKMAVSSTARRRVCLGAIEAMAAGKRLRRSSV